MNPLRIKKKKPHQNRQLKSLTEKCVDWTINKTFNAIRSSKDIYSYFNEKVDESIYSYKIQNEVNPYITISDNIFQGIENIIDNTKKKSNKLYSNLKEEVSLIKEGVNSLSYTTKKALSVSAVLFHLFPIVTNDIQTNFNGNNGFINTILGSQSEPWKLDTQLDSFAASKNEAIEDFIGPPKPYKTKLSSLVNSNIDDLIRPQIEEKLVSYLRVFTGASKNAEEVSQKYENMGFTVEIDKLDEPNKKSWSIVRVKTYDSKITKWLKNNEKDFLDAYEERLPRDLKIYTEKQLKDIVHILSYQKGIDPRLGYALAYNESKFDQYAIGCKFKIVYNESSSGQIKKSFVIDQDANGAPKKITALGIMQLNPRNNFKKSDGSILTWDEMLEDPVKNISVGLDYFKKLQDRFGSDELAIAAYNAGPTKVINGKWRQYPETNKHVRKIGLTKESRKKIHPNEDMSVYLLSYNQK